MPSPVILGRSEGLVYPAPDEAIHRTGTRGRNPSLRLGMTGEIESIITGEVTL